MTTIQKAMRTAEQGGDPLIKAKLVCKQIFVKRREGQTTKLLIEVFIDQDGAVIEVKSWSERKIYTVFRKFGQDSCVEIAASGEFREPNRKYSMARCETYHSWFITPLNDFKLKHYIYCQSNIETFHKKTKKPASVVGLFASMTPGPQRKTSSGFVLAQGYYVQLIDDMGNIFQALVWSNVHIDKGNFALNHCNQNNVVLIVYAREQEERYKTRTYTITSTYPPVVDPGCVNPQTCLALKRRLQTLGYERCVRYSEDCDAYAISARVV